MSKPVHHPSRRQLPPTLPPSSPSSTSASTDAAAFKIALPLGLLVLILAAFSVFFLCARLGALRWCTSRVRRRNEASESTSVYQRTASGNASTAQLGDGDASTPASDTSAATTPTTTSTPRTWLQRLVAPFIMPSPPPRPSPATQQQPSRRRRRPRLGDGPHRTDSGRSVRTVPVYKEEVGDDEMVLWKSWTNMSGASETSIPLNDVAADDPREEAHDGNRFVSIDMGADEPGGPQRRHSIAETAPSLTQRALSPVRRLGGSLRWSWVAGAPPTSTDVAAGCNLARLGRTDEEEATTTMELPPINAQPDSTPDYDALYPGTAEPPSSATAASFATARQEEEGPSTQQRLSVASRLMTRLRSSRAPQLNVVSPESPSRPSDAGDVQTRPSIAASRTSSVFFGRTLTSEQAAFLSSSENLGRYGIVNLSITDLGDGGRATPSGGEEEDGAPPPSWEEIQGGSEAREDPPASTDKEQAPPAVGGARPPPLVLASERALNAARESGSAEV